MLFNFAFVSIFCRKNIFGKRITIYYAITDNDDLLRTYIIIGIIALVFIETLNTTSQENVPILSIKRG